jgi:hypothetical protein
MDVDRSSGNIHQQATHACNSSASYHALTQPFTAHDVFMSLSC